MAYIDSRGVAIQPYTLGITPITSLSAVSATGAGTVLDGLSIRAFAVLVVSSSAGVSAGSVQLQGSLDAINWYPLGTAISTVTASTVYTPIVDASGYSRYVRANVATAITGGTISATVGLSG